jgi:hypothetical protein
MKLIAYQIQKVLYAIRLRTFSFSRTSIPPWGAVAIATELPSSGKEQESEQVHNLFSAEGSVVLL